MPGGNLPTKVGLEHQQTKFTYNHWLAALVKGKCSSTKPAHFATGVVCHLDTEQNRPLQITLKYFPFVVQGHCVIKLKKFHRY